MRAVDVGVGHDDDAVVAQLRNVEAAVRIFHAGILNAGTERHDQRANVVAAENLVDARLLNVEQLAAQWEDCLESSIASLLCGTTGRLTLHDVEL